MSRFHLHSNPAPSRAPKAAFVGMAVGVAVLGAMAMLALGDGDPRPAARDEAVRTNDVNTLRDLADAGVDLHARDIAGSTLLHGAAYWGSLDVAAFLVEEGLSVNAMNGQGATPLHEAARGGRADMARWLLASGADPGRRTTQEILQCDGRRIPAGATPTDVARAVGNVAVVDLLGMSRVEGARSAR